tara:strand:- start:745 stop:2439 length:1695 start_codon:yes stop_codon:yes gene_type:complete
MNLKNFLENTHFVVLGVCLLCLQIALAHMDELWVRTIAFNLHAALFLSANATTWPEVAGWRRWVLSLVVVSLVLLANFFTPFMAIWLGLASSFVAGKILQTQGTRVAYGLVILILFWDLFILVLPMIAEVNPWGRDGQLLLIIVGALLSLGLIVRPVWKPMLASDTDIVHVFTTGLLVSQICLATLLMMNHTALSFFSSLVLSVVTVLAILLSIAILWSPSHGRPGLRDWWTSYLFNLGTPLENWLNQLIRLGEVKRISSSSFLLANLEQLNQFPWIDGVKWVEQGEEGMYGEPTGHSTYWEQSGLELTIYSPYRLGPVLEIHTTLLLRLLSFFYQAKQQEESLTQQTQLKAIYETGSKVTHDIKNILQSLQSMMAISQRSDVDQQQVYPMFAQQIPLLYERLSLTLGKLQAPVVDDDGELLPLVEWWHRLDARFLGRGIVFSMTGEPASESKTLILASVLDSILENLLENARSKRQFEGEIDIHVELKWGGRSRWRVSVTDSGSAVPDDILPMLFKKVVPSARGFGTGLYQCAKMARRYGYALLLTHNANGHVVFDVSPEEDV